MFYPEAFPEATPKLTARETVEMEFAAMCLLLQADRAVLARLTALRPIRPTPTECARPDARRPSSHPESSSSSCSNAGSPISISMPDLNPEPSPTTHHSPKDPPRPTPKRTRMIEIRHKDSG